jgi:hypothetical protein
MTARPRAERRWVRILIIVLLGNLMAFLAGEVLVRVLGHTDADGNFWLGGTIQGPVRPQLSRLTSLVQELETREEESLVTYDADLGWNYRPGATSGNGLYHIDERGVRTAAQARPQRDGPIIALYGGSVTFCTGVLFEESWGYLLEALLEESGKEYRVINHGVGGYDMGQALLRWRSTHAELQPEIVIFGLSPENIFGNVSIIRAFHAPNTALPYSKPRFVLEGNELRVVNVPCLPPRDVLEVLRDPKSWDLLPMETFYTDFDHEEGVFWHHSRLLRVLIDRINRWGDLGNMNVYYNSGTEAFRVSVNIIQRFHDDVRAAGARFVMVHLPNQSQLDKALAGKPMPQTPLLAELSRRGMTVVDPTPELLELARRTGPAKLFGPDLHFSPQSNRAIAKLLARSLREMGAEAPSTPSIKSN